MATAPTIDSLIDKTPELRGGRPVILGTGTTVRAVVGLYKPGLTAEEIATQFPHLELAQSYVGLTHSQIVTASTRSDASDKDDASVCQNSVEY